MLNLNKWMLEKGEIQQQLQNSQSKIDQIMLALGEIRQEMNLQKEQFKKIDENIASEKDRVTNLLVSMTQQLQDKVTFALQEDMVVVLENDIVVDAFEYEEALQQDQKGQWIHAFCKKSPFQSRENHIAYSKNIGWVYGQLETL